MTPGLWTHEWRPICFSLLVDDFGVKYVGEEHAAHLVAALKETYDIEVDEKGEKYVGISLDWDYENGEVHLSMPGYVSEALARFRHLYTQRRQHGAIYGSSVVEESSHDLLDEGFLFFCIQS